MKKSLFVILVATIAILALAVSAYATYPPHGMAGDLEKPFFQPEGSSQPDGCAGCHRAHTAVGSRLAFARGTSAVTGGTSVTPDGSPSAFCLVCHGISGTLANTNVVDGIGYANRKPGGVNAAGALNGGGFRGMTSTHNVDGTARTIWGGGTSSDDEAGNTMVLNCGDCHDPHGTPNYRLLKTDADGKEVESLETGYGTSSYAPDFNNTKYKKGATVDAGISASCWKCHKKYKKVDTADSGDGVYNGTEKYRHPVNVAMSTWKDKFSPDSGSHLTTTLPLEKATDGEAQVDQWLNCLTCHKAHGTTATMTTDATVGPAASSALLRLNNRGVCQDCHQK